MKNLITTLWVLLLSVVAAEAQFARLQVIHNAPDAAVDVYLNGVLALDNFAFRKATPFLNVPAGVPVSVAIAPENSSSSADAFFTASPTFQSGKTYAITAIGIDGNAVTPFSLVIDDAAREGASNPAKVDLNVLHGALNAPSVDVAVRAGNKIVSNLAYGAFTPYLGVDPGVYYLDVKPAGGNTIVGTYKADLSTLTGGSARIFASGLLGGSPGFGLFAALANGTVVELPLSPVARVQVIHNSPDQTVDIYANGSLLIDDITYFSASPFLFVPAGNVNIGVALDNSLSVEDTLVNVKAALTNGSTYVIVANGILGDPNSPFQLAINENAREVAADTSKVDVSLFHGSPDAPAVDVDAIFVANNAVTNLAYGNFSPAYLSVDPAINDFTLRVAGTANVVNTYRADLSSLKGKAVTVLAGGFLAGPPDFGLFAVLTDGTILKLPLTPMARLQVIHNAPAPTVDVYAGTVRLIDNFAFRTATPYIDVPANRTFMVGIAPQNSNSAADALASFPVTADSGKTYAAFASGIPGNPGTPLALLIDESRESAINPANIEFNVHHGSPNVPPVEAGITGIGIIIPDIAYKGFSPYFSLPPTTYQITVKPVGSGDSPDIFIANLNGLAGKAARVFASGLANGVPGFGLFAAFSDGTVVEFPRLPGPARLQVIHNAPGNQTVDIYANNDLLINDFQFRTATPFIDIPGGNTTIAVAPGNSTSAADAFATFNLTIESEFTYVITATGTAGGSPDFNLVVNSDGLEQAVSGSKVDISVLHGAPDAPAVDVDAVFVANNVVSNLAYGGFTPYLHLEPDAYDFAVRATGSPDVVASYRADLSNLAGAAATVFASGYLSGTPAFGLFAAFPDGSVVELPVTPTARLQVIHNAPDPTVDVYAGNTQLIDNFAFRTATPYMDVPADRVFKIGIAPDTSTAATSAIASFPVSFTAGKRFAVFASGIVGGNPGFALLVDESRETANNPAKVEFATHHGSPDAPAVDVSIFGTGPIANGLQYGDFSPYVAVDPAGYLVQLKLAGTNTVVGTYQADLGALAGVAARVFASGFVNGVPGLGLFAALADGTVVEFPQVANPSSARLQLIHNSPSPTVDVYVNGDLLLDNFEFRTATPFIDVLANVPLSIAVAPGTSASVADAIATFPVTFNEGQTYIVTASGIAGDPNTPFTLITDNAGREKSNAPGQVDVAVLHGSPDAPAVDVDAVFLADNVVDNLAYGEFTPYLSFDPDKYDLAVRVHGSPDVVASYRADLSGLAGGAAYVFASGLLGGTPAFGLFAAFPDGTVIELPLTPTTRVQIVHNAPTPTVDMYAGNTLLLDNFAFRTATPFVDIPADRNISVGIAPDNSNSVDDALVSFPVNFAEGKTYQVMAAGIVGSPDKPFSLYVDDKARETAAPGFTSVSTFHGLITPNDLNIDVSERLIGALSSGIGFGAFTPYQDLSNGEYYLDITDAATTGLLGTHRIDPALFADKVVRIFTSGILDGNPGYGLFAVFADGTVVELPYTPVARVQIIHNSPDPVVDVYAGDNLLIDDFEFRTATPFIYVPAEVSIPIGVAPGSSQSSADVIAAFPTTFENRKTYVVVASGIVGGNPGFDLIVNDMGRERALDDSKMELAILHGAPDAPDVDITPFGSGTPLLAGLQYGQFTGYLSFDPGLLLLDLSVSGDPNQLIGTWGGDFTGLGGLTGVIFASGLVNSDPEFDLWLALPDGTTLPLPSFARAQVIHNAPSPTVDVYFDDVQILDNFAFHEATGIGLFPARTPFTLSVAPANSTSSADAIYDLPVAGLKTGKTYIIMAAGEVGGNPGFGLFINENGRGRAFNSANVEAELFHGAPDAPEVDVKLQGGPVIFDNVSFGQFTDYLSVPPANYTIQVTPADDNAAILKTYIADFSSLGGQAITVFASGYLTGAQPGFQVWVAEIDGTTYPLEEIVRTNDLADGLDDLRISPNPAVDNLFVQFSLNEAKALRYGVRDVTGRLVLEGDFGTVSAGAFSRKLGLGRLPAGMYQLELVSGDGVQTVKFVVQR